MTCNLGEVMVAMDHIFVRLHRVQWLQCISFSSQTFSFILIVTVYHLYFSVLWALKSWSRWVNNLTSFVWNCDYIILLCKLPHCNIIFLLFRLHLILLLNLSLMHGVSCQCSYPNKTLITGIGHKICEF